MERLDSTYWSRLNAQRFSRRTMLRSTGLAGAGIAAAALVGCGGDDEETEATTAPTSAATTAPGATEVVSTGKPGGRLQISQAGDPPSFDLHQESTTYTNAVTSMAYNQLVRFDPAAVDEPPDAIISDLASEWEISPDGQTYTFHLVQNATYHDGTPFTAADVKASYERQLNPPEGLVNPPRGAQIQWIESIDTPDDHTLVINTNRPVSSLSVLPILAQGWMAIYSHAIIEAGFDKKALPVGTGPFMIESYEQGSKVTYNKNPNYWVPERPYLDGVDMYIIPDVSTTLANFQGGQLHVYSPNKKDLESLMAALGDKVVAQEGIKSLGFDCINFGGREPWTDVRVRQAVTMAHNKQQSIDVLKFGDARFGGYMNPGGYWTLSDEEFAAIPGYAPFTDNTIAEARKLLDAAGVPESLDATILTRQGASFEPFSLYVQDQLSKVGINATLDIQETASAYDILAKRDFDLAPWVHGIALDDPDAIFAEFYITGGPRNYSQISTPEIDDLYIKQSSELDPEARKALVKELQQLALPEYSKMITTWGLGRSLRWATVKDYVAHNNSYNNARWQQVWLDA